jgi:glycosyltransferase involved in cell wall biosynthesis
MQGLASAPFVITMVATLPRIGELTSTSIPSIYQQETKPDLVLIIADKQVIDHQTQNAISLLLDMIPVVFLNNNNTSGAAGSWNTGINWVNEHHPKSYIAILDDDDYWHESHIKECLQTLELAPNSDLVLSNITMIKKGIETVKTLPHSITKEQFLTGNPGWQGSNTFIKTSSIITAGQFNEAFQSTNDRDLAVRFLSLDRMLVSLTHKQTVYWVCQSRPDALSQPGSPKKLQGLAMFYLHHLKDSQCKETLNAFFNRCESIFKISKHEIINYSYLK